MGDTSCSSMTAPTTTAPTSLLIACGNHEPCYSPSSSDVDPTQTDASNTLTSDQWRTTNRISSPYHESFTMTSSSSQSTLATITRFSLVEMSSLLSSSATSSLAQSSTPAIDTNQASQADIGSTSTSASASRSTSISTTSTTSTTSTSISNTSTSASGSGADSKPSSIWIGSVTASVCAFLILIGLILCTSIVQNPPYDQSRSSLSNRKVAIFPFSRAIAPSPMPPSSQSSQKLFPKATIP